MYKYKKSVIIVLIIAIAMIIILTVSNSEFRAFEREFNEAYFSVASNIDIKNTYQSLQNLQSDICEANLVAMKMLLDNMSEKVKPNRRNRYNEMIKQYDGLLFLKESFVRWDTLIVDEKRRINNELWWAFYLHREYSKKND